MNLASGYASQASFVNYVRRSSSGVDSFDTDIYTHFALYLSGKYDDQRKLSSLANISRLWLCLVNCDIQSLSRVCIVWVEPQHFA